MLNHQSATINRQCRSQLFAVLILARGSPRSAARLASRISREVAGAAVCGMIYVSPPREPFVTRAANFFGHLGEWAFVRYALESTLRQLGAAASALGALLLRLVHASPAYPDPQSRFGVEDLRAFCESTRIPILVTTDPSSADALAVARKLQPDLGVLHDAQPPGRGLLDIPKQGWIGVHKGRVADSRGEGPVGLWELVDGQQEVGIAVRRESSTLHPGAVVQAGTLAIEPYDTLTCLALKASVIASDLLVQALAEFVQGTVSEKPAEARRAASQPLAPHSVTAYKKQIAARRPPYQVPRRWPVWKLLLRTVLFGPVFTARNWIHRLRGRFPVVILSHHLVSDRPHRMGLPTELFLRRVRFLQRYYRIVSLSEAVELLAANKVTVSALVLTFDDGYRDNFLTLRAVAEETGVPFTLFVCTGNVT